MNKEEKMKQLDASLDHYNMLDMKLAEETNIWYKGPNDIVKVVNFINIAGIAISIFTKNFDATTSFYRLAISSSAVYASNYILAKKEESDDEKRDLMFYEVIKNFQNADIHDKSYRNISTIKGFNIKELDIVEKEKLKTKQKILKEKRKQL